MPSWQPNWTDVEFDDAAAHRLVTTYEHVADRLEGHADARGSSAARALADWQGQARDSAEPVLTEVTDRLEDLVRSLRGDANDVADSARLARQEQARRVDDRARWRREHEREAEAAREALAEAQQHG